MNGQGDFFFSFGMQTFFFLWCFFFSSFCIQYGLDEGTMVMSGQEDVFGRGELHRAPKMRRLKGVINGSTDVYYTSICNMSIAMFARTHTHTPTHTHTHTHGRRYVGADAGAGKINGCVYLSLHRAGQTLAL